MRAPKMGGDDVCHRGLPDMTSEERDEGAKKLTTTVAGSLVVVSCVGTAIAEATYRLGATSKAAAKIATLGGLDLGLAVPRDLRRHAHRRPREHVPDDLQGPRHALEERQPASQHVRSATRGVRTRDS